MLDTHADLDATLASSSKRLDLEQGPLRWTVMKETTRGPQVCESVCVDYSRTRRHARSYRNRCACICVNVQCVYVYTRMNKHLTHALQERIMSLDLVSQHLIFATPSGEVDRTLF